MEFEPDRIGPTSNPGLAASRLLPSSVATANALSCEPRFGYTTSAAVYVVPESGPNEPSGPSESGSKPSDTSKESSGCEVPSPCVCAPTGETAATVNSSASTGDSGHMTATALKAKVEERRTN